LAAALIKKSPCATAKELKEFQRKGFRKSEARWAITSPNTDALPARLLRKFGVSFALRARLDQSLSATKLLEMWEKADPELAESFTANQEANARPPQIPDLAA
jgi:hypothetical protein